MGMANLFGDAANFSNAFVKSSANQTLHLSNVIQKVVIDVNEFGIGHAVPSKGR